MLVDVLENYKKYKDLAKRQRYFVNTNFTETAVSKQYNKVLKIIDSDIKEIPQQVELKLPKLNLPKLQKV